MRRKLDPRSPYFHPKSIVEDKRAVGSGSRVWAFAHLMKGSSIGKGCNIGDHCFVEQGCKIGDRVTLKNGVSVWEKVLIEDDVFVGPNAVFTNDLFPISKAKPTLLSTHVRKGVCIGANAVIVCGHTLGRYAFVGAGSVVTRDVPDHALVYGNPAKVHAWLCRCRKKLTFRGRSARCVCGAEYTRSKNGVVEETSCRA